jgi:hypothetical protein
MVFYIAWNRIINISTISHGWSFVELAQFPGGRLRASMGGNRGVTFLYSEETYGPGTSGRRYLRVAIYRFPSFAVRYWPVVNAIILCGCW